MTNTKELECPSKSEEGRRDLFLQHLKALFVAHHPKAYDSLRYDDSDFRPVAANYYELAGRIPTDHIVRFIRTFEEAWPRPSDWTNKVSVYLRSLEPPEVQKEHTETEKRYNGIQSFILTFYVLLMGSKPGEEQIGRIFRRMILEAGLPLLKIPTFFTRAHPELLDQSSRPDLEPNLGIINKLRDRVPMLSITAVNVPGISRRGER